MELNFEKKINAALHSRMEILEATIMETLNKNMVNIESKLQTSI